MGFSEIDVSQDVLESAPEDVAPLLEGLSGIDALHVASAGLSVSQLIYSQTYLTGIKQARKAKEFYLTMQQQTKDDIIYDVASNYYRVLMSYSSLNILDENIRNLQKLYEILYLQYTNDFVKLTDVNRLKVTVTNLETQREILQNAINIQERVLKIICGIPLEQVRCNRFHSHF